MKTFTTTLAIVSAAFLVWIGASLIDITWDNLSDNPKHSNINFFVLMCEWGEEIHGEGLYD